MRRSTRNRSLIGYSSHEGAEQADWDDDEKLERVEETHPVVYPGAGSHANKFTEALYLGSSAEAGVGCDDTRGPHRELRPAVATIPSDPDAAAAAFPWIEFEGRWGELQRAFFNGPTGPNLKGQWTEPISWSDDWRERSYAVPTGGLFGTGATDLFCSGVERGSRALILFLQDPALVALVLAAIAALVAFVTIRATWTPVAPLRLGRRRSWGQILSASGSMYVRHARVFLGIGLLLIPIVLVITFLQWLVLEGLGHVGISSTGEIAGGAALLALIIGTTLALLGLGLVQAATACALVEIDAGRQVGAVSAYAKALRRVRPLLGAIGLFVAAWVVLTTTTFLIPVAIWLAVRWCLLAPVVELEDLRGPSALRQQRKVGAQALVAHSLARRSERGNLARRRPASRRLVDLRRGRAARDDQHRRRDRLRGRAPVRRARHGVRLLRRTDARRARAVGRGARAACRDRSRRGVSRPDSASDEFSPGRRSRAVMRLKPD